MQVSGQANICGEFGVLGLICSGTIANGGRSGSGRRRMSNWQRKQNGASLHNRVSQKIGHPITQSLLWLAGLSTRERNPTRGGLWLSFLREFRDFRKLPTHLVVALVGGVPQGRRRRLLLVRHHPQQLLNLEAEDTLQG